MRFLRTNTAVRLTVGPFFDKTDGVTPEVAITVTSCKLTLMVDDANVPTLVLDTAPTASGGANDMVHVTGDDAGFYDLELAAANVNYLGRAMLAITDAAVHCPVFHEFMILPAMIYDSLVLGTDRLDTNVTHVGDTSQTARDLGASVLLSSGTGTGQLDFTSGVVKANLAQILGTALTETAGLLAGGFKKFFNVSTPTGTVNSIPDAVAGAASGLALVGSNVGVATSVSGAVGSVTGAVGSVTGLTAATVHADLDDIQARLPAALTAGGKIKASMDEILAVGQSATDLKDFADDGYDPSTNKVQGVVLTDTVTTYTGNTLQTGDSFARLGAPAGASVSADIAAIEAQTDDIGVAGAGLTALGDTRLANLDATVSSRLASASYTTPPTVGAIADQVWDEAIAGHAGAGSTGEALSDAGGAGTPPTVGEIADAVWEEAIADHSGTSGSTAEALGAAGSAGDPWTTALPGAYGSGSAGKILGDNLNATISSRATPAQVNTEADTALADVGLTTTITGRIDAAISTRTKPADTQARVTLVDTVTTYTGNTPQTGDAYARLGAPVGASVSADLAAKASQASVDDLPTNAELATSQAAADDATLAAIAGLNNLSQANIRTAVGLASANLDTQLDAIPTNAELSTALGTADDATLAAIAALSIPTAVQNRQEMDSNSTKLASIDAKTTNLPAAPAATGDIPTATQNADALLARDLGSGSGAGSLNERTVRSALRFNRNRFTIAGGTLTVYREDDTTVAFTAVITQTAGDPVSASDPA